MTDSFLLKHIVLNAYLRSEILRLLAEIRLWLDARDESS